jgi:hypothetical protein
MEMIKDLWNNSTRRHWGDGLRWFWWNVIGGFLPLWATLIGLKMTKQPLSLESVASKGEFALYSAALIAGSLYLVVKDFRLRDIKSFRDLRKGLFPSMGAVALILVALLILSAVTFAFVCLLDVLGATGKPEILTLVDRRFLCLSTEIIMTATIVLALLIVVADSSRGDFDPHAISSDEMASLKKKFKNLPE